MTASILTTLDTLSLEFDQHIESEGQCLDLMCQALEHWHQSQGREQPRSSLGGHADDLIQANAPQSLRDALETARQRRRELNACTDEETILTALSKLKDAARFTILESGCGGQSAVHRIRYLPLMVNTVGIETPSGFRQFQLHHGSSIRLKCDLLVVSARHLPDGTFEGQMAKALKSRYGIRLDPEKHDMNHGSGVWTSLEKSTDSAPFSHVLVMWLPGDWELTNTEGDAEAYEHAIRSVFAHLLAIEHQGTELKTIGLDFLGGHRSRGLDTAVETLLFSAIRWMKRAERAETISLALSDRNQLEDANTAMDKALGRVYVGHDGDPVLEALRDEVLVYARRHKEGSLEPALRPMIEALQVQGALCIELICTFARALCELTAKQSLMALGQKPSGDLLSSIEKLRQSGTVAPWVCSYMHGLRVLGNKSVHPADSPPRYEPQRLDTSDLVSALAATRCLLTWWDQRGTGTEST